MLTLHFNNTTLDVQESDSSYRYRSLMAKPQLVLKFVLSEFVEIPVGAWCEYQGVKYAAWEKYPAFFEETEKEPKEKKEAKQKTASELVDNLVEKLTKRELEEDVETIENLRLISSAPEVFKLVRTGHIDTEVLRWLAVPKNLEEVKTKMAEAAK